MEYQSTSISTTTTNRDPPMSCGLPLYRVLDAEEEDKDEDEEEDFLRSPESVTTSPSHGCLSGSSAGANLPRIVVGTLLLACVCLTSGLLVVFLGTKERKGAHDVNNETFYFFQVSDTHLDLYYDSNMSSTNGTFCRSIPTTHGGGRIASDNRGDYGRIKCDASTKLVQSAAEEIARVGERVDAKFLVFTGDQAAHSYEFFRTRGSAKENIIWSIGNSTRAFSRALPHLPLFLTFGNNDLPQDYHPPVTREATAEWYGYFLPVWRELAACVSCKRMPLLSQDFNETFLNGGYYRVDVLDGRLSVLALNTGYFSRKANSLNPSVTRIGDEQLEWLKEELNKANQSERKVLIIGHKAPGISMYSGTENFLLNYTSAYLRLVAGTYRDIITAQLFGHTHHDMLKLQYLDDHFKPHLHEQSGPGNEKSFAFLCPGITPVYGNNPAFRLYELDRRKLIVNDYSQYYFDLLLSNVLSVPLWYVDYRFRSAYNISSVTVTIVEQIFDWMLEPSNRGRSWQTYATHYAVRNQVDGSTRVKHYCSGRHSSLPAYRACMYYYHNIGN